MKLHCLQHVPFETPGSIGHWAREGGHGVTVTARWSPVEANLTKRDQLTGNGSAPAGAGGSGRGERASAVIAKVRWNFSLRVSQ